MLAIQVRNVKKVYERGGQALPVLDGLTVEIVFG
jgi:hypothetical protein